MAPGPPACAYDFIEEHKYHQDAVFGGIKYIYILLHSHLPRDCPFFYAKAFPQVETKQDKNMQRNPLTKQTCNAQHCFSKTVYSKTIAYKGENVAFLQG